MGETRRTTHALKYTYGTWSAETEDRVVAEVADLIKNLDVPSIKTAARSYEDAAEALETAKEAIRAEAVKLERVWEGEASVEAQTALGVLYVTMEGLAEKLRTMRGAVDELADVVTGHQGFVNDEIKGVLFTWVNQGVGDIGSFSDDWKDWNSTYTGYYAGNQATSKWETPNKMAGEHLQIFTNDLAQVWEKVPSEVETVLRDIKPPQPTTNTPPPVRYPTGGTNSSSPSYDGAGWNGSGSNGGPPFGNLRPDTGVTDPRGVDPTTGYPPGSNSPGTDPNALNPPGTDVPGGATPVGQAPNLGTTVPPADTAGLNRDPSLTGRDTTTKLADYTPNTPTYSPTTTPGYAVPTSSSTPTTGTYGGTGTGGGVVPGQATSLSTRAGTGVGGGMPFLPMSGAGGAGGGGESKDRESTTWLHEDDDVWGDDTGSVNGLIS